MVGKTALGHQIFFLSKPCFAVDLVISEYMASRMSYFQESIYKTFLEPMFSIFYIPGDSV